MWGKKNSGYNPSPSRSEFKPYQLKLGFPLISYKVDPNFISVVHSSRLNDFVSCDHW